MASVQLPPLHFVTGGQPVWPEILDDRLAALTESVLAERCISSYDNWILQCYVRLRQAGHHPTISPDPVTAKVNVIDGWNLRIRDRTAGLFVLVTRADSHRPFLANYWIEQNGLRGDGACHSWIPHWPQPDVLPRDTSRGTRIETLGYKGLARNLDRAFSVEKLGPMLDAEKVCLECDLEDRASGALRWNDYRALDLCLAVRNLTKSDANGKPASKLVNAWMARVPALVGPEPAFLELKKSALDFIEVRSPADVLDAIRMLRNDPDLYTAMAENGLRRAQDFTVGTVTRRWVEVLSGPVKTLFDQWQRTPHLMKLSRHAIGVPLDKAARRYHRHQARYGPRLL